MRQWLLSMFSGGLAAAAICGYAADSPATPISIHQFVADALEGTDRAFSALCSSHYATLKAAFDAATKSSAVRVDSMLTELLQTEQFKSLVHETAPQDLIDTYSFNAAMVRDSASVPSQADCAGILGDMSKRTDAQLRGEIAQMLANTKAIMKMRASRAPTK
jgi:hypothetical protein